jgi:hypothetical protein
LKEFRRQMNQRIPADHPRGKPQAKQFEQEFAKIAEGPGIPAPLNALCGLCVLLFHAGKTSFCTLAARMDTDQQRQKSPLSIRENPRHPRSI